MFRQDEGGNDMGRPAAFQSQSSGITFEAFATRPLCNPRTLRKGGEGLRHPRMFFTGVSGIVVFDEVERFESQREN